MQDDIVKNIANYLKEHNLNLATAESCTGGNIAHQITKFSGASSYFKGAIVSYCNEVKSNLLFVDRALLDIQGAVNQDVVIQMCQGAIQQFNTDYALSVSGLAGPNGDGTDVKVGTVWVCAMNRGGKYITKTAVFEEDRIDFIQHATIFALNALYELMLS